MSARRSMKRNTRISPRGHRCKYLLEGLETRVLFNTIITDTDPLTITPPTQTLEYKDARGQNVRITVHGDVSAVGAKSEAAHFPADRQGPAARAGRHVPEADRTVRRARDQELPVRTERQRLDTARVVTEEVLRLSRVRVPEPDRRIGATRGEPAAVGTVGDRKDVAAVPGQYRTST